jgi:2-isopropylmalate synthase
MQKVRIFDTTLRDGEQALLSSLNVEEKLQIARQLAKLKVDVIEAGFPISSPGDFTSVQTIARQVKGPIICGLARAVRKDIDSCVAAVKPAARHLVHTFIAVSDIHMQRKLRKPPEEVLAMAVDAVRYARRKCMAVEFSAEDAGRSRIDFLCRVVEAVIKAGASVVNIPDTTGYTVPEEYGEIISALYNRVPNIDQAIISVHCHNDLGLAVANSVTAVMHGARQVECAVNGMGERAGNAALEEVVMILKTRKPFLKLETGVDTREIMNTSRLVSRLCNLAVAANKSIVGGNAFTHSSGIHGDGVIKDRSTYEIMTPESVGLSVNILNLTSRSGRAMVKDRLRSLGYADGSYDLEAFYEKFLKLADKKGTIYDDDMIALMETGEEEFKDAFLLKYLNVSSGTNVVPTATVIVVKDGVEHQEAACGDGPVDASYKVLERLTGIKIKVEDYKLRSTGGGQEAMGQVDIVASCQGQKYHGIGASTDIVEASALAFLSVANKVHRIQTIRKRKK